MTSKYPIIHSHSPRTHWAILALQIWFLLTFLICNTTWKAINLWKHWAIYDICNSIMIRTYFLSYFDSKAIGNIQQIDSISKRIWTCPHISNHYTFFPFQSNILDIQRLLLDLWNKQFLDYFFPFWMSLRCSLSAVRIFIPQSTAYITIIERGMQESGQELLILRIWPKSPSNVLRCLLSLTFLYPF